MNCSKFLFWVWRESRPCRSVALLNRQTQSESGSWPNRFRKSYLQPSSSLKIEIISSCPGWQACLQEHLDITIEMQLNLRTRTASRANGLLLQVSWTPVRQERLVQLSSDFLRLSRTKIKSWPVINSNKANYSSHIAISPQEVLLNRVTQNAAGQTLDCQITFSFFFNIFTSWCESHQDSSLLPPSRTNLFLVNVKQKPH